MDHKLDSTREAPTVVGWISRKNLASGRGGCFFLTSLFIELIYPTAVLSAIAVSNSYLQLRFNSHTCFRFHRQKQNRCQY
jgi:hypothetical protein